jgi:hypothetical protein
MNKVTSFFGKSSLGRFSELMGAFADVFVADSVDLMVWFLF